jgi:hypothetical protein
MRCSPAPESPPKPAPRQPLSPDGHEYIPLLAIRNLNHRFVEQLTPERKQLHKVLRTTHLHNTS